MGAMGDAWLNLFSVLSGRWWMVFFLVFVLASVFFCSEGYFWGL